MDELDDAITRAKRTAWQLSTEIGKAHDAAISQPMPPQGRSREDMALVAYLSIQWKSARELVAAMECLG